MICPACRNEVGAGFAFCPRCGTPLPPPACPACRQPAAPGNAFCANCGAPLAPSAPAVPAPPAVPVNAPPPPADARILQTPGPVPGPAPAAPPPKKSGCLGAGIGCLVLIVLLVGAFIALGGPDLIEEWMGGGSDGGDAPAKGVKLDPDTPPVKFTRPFVSPLASIPLGQSLFAFKVENISACDLSAVKLAAVLFDENGKRLPGDPLEVGVAADVGDIHPGDTYECKFTSGNPAAVSAAVVLKEVVYVYRPEGKGMELYAVPMKWTNKKHDAEVEVAKPE